MEVGDKKVKDFVKYMLSVNSKWAIKALTVIYTYQTNEEKNSLHTNELNGVGFGKFDAEILSSLCKQYNSGRPLTQNQLGVLFNRMPKYWKQIIEISKLQGKYEAMCDQAKKYYNDFDNNLESTVTESTSEYTRIPVVVVGSNDVSPNKDLLKLAVKIACMKHKISTGDDKVKIKLLDDISFVDRNKYKIVITLNDEGHYIEV